MSGGLTASDNALLDDISRRSFRYFWEQTNLRTGLVLDRARIDGKPDDNPNHRGVSSIAATGFGLTALAIAADHRWVSPELARRRVLTTLRFFARRAPHERGWFYHFVDAATGERRWKSEISSIDTALLLAGILTVRQAFSDDSEIVQLATLIYNRVDFGWMLDGSGKALSHGWTPEKGFLPYRWDTYNELMILYVLAIGSPTHPISPDAWYSWNLPVASLGEHTYVGRGPLFTHQYSQAWVDLRGRGAPNPRTPEFVPRVDYFANSVAATRAQQALAVDLSERFPGYSSEVWGITASDSAKGYVDWGGSGRDPRIDGTVVPSAAGGSLMFAPQICIAALRAMVLQFGRKVYGRYGFVDAFNPTTGWVSPYVIAINTGITLLSAENLRTGNVWLWFMRNPEAERSLDFVGFAPDLSLAFERGTTTRIALEGQTTEPGQTGERSGPPSPLLDEYQIPASAFKFKILLPDYWAH
ncbi:MAG: glucoamylase family protein [Terriglobia bacterium]